MNVDFSDDSFASSKVCYESEFLESPFTDEDLQTIERIEETYNTKGGKTFQCSLCFAKLRKDEDLRHHKELFHPICLSSSLGKI